MRIHDERRAAPVVREWTSRTVNREQFRQDRANLARALWRLHTPKHLIAQVIGVDWTQVDEILKGER